MHSRWLAISSVSLALLVGCGKKDKSNNAHDTELANAAGA
jgi:hypothetical protein